MQQHAMVYLTSLAKSGSEPCSSRRPTISVHPFWEAMAKGVTPPPASEFFWLTSTSCHRRTRVPDRTLYRAAYCSGYLFIGVSCSYPSLTETFPNSYYKRIPNYATVVSDCHRLTAVNQHNMLHLEDRICVIRNLTYTIVALSFIAAGYKVISGATCATLGPRESVAIALDLCRSSYIAETVLRTSVLYFLFPYS